MKFHYVSLLVLIILFSACEQSKQEEDLQQRSEALQAEKQRLQHWEQTLKLKEKELAKREKVVDSTSKRLDSVGIYDPKLIGNWHVSMHCTETSCAGSAIGDTKTEQWEITYQNNQVIAKVTSNKKLNRVYRGFYKAHLLQLTTQLEEEDMNTVITINLRPSGTNQLEGERVISHVGNCKITYAIAIEKM